MNGNITVRGRTNPRVVFTFGWLIQSIAASPVSNGAGGFLVRVTSTTNSVAFSDFKVGNDQVFISGANTNTGINNAEFKLTVIDDHTIDLQGTTFTNGQGIGGMAAYAPLQPGFSFYGTGPYGAGATQMRNFVLCRLADETDIDNGLIVDTKLINQYKELYNTGGRGVPGWFRFMDMIGVQTNFEGDFSQRMRATSVSYAVNRFPLGYWTGNISWSAGDNYTCDDPGRVVSAGVTVAPLNQGVSVWDAANSRYFDGAIVQGNIDLSNLGPSPTLNVNGHGAKPIYDFVITQRVLKFWGRLPSTGGQTISVSFQASWLNGNVPVQVDYITSTGINFTGTTTGSSANVTVAGLTGNTLFPGNFVHVPGLPDGRVTVIAGPAGGGNGVYVFSEALGLSGTPLSTQNDTASFATLAGNLNTAFFVNPLIAGSGIHFGSGTINCRTSRAGPLSVTFVAGPAGFNMTTGVFAPLAISTNDNSVPNVLQATMAGTIATGDVLNFVFNRLDLPSGTHTVSYTTNTAVDVSLSALVANIVAKINADGYLSGVGIQALTGGAPANSFDVYQGVHGTVALFMGYISGTTLNVTSMNNAGLIAAGSYVDNNTNIKLYTQIISQITPLIGSETLGGVGRYTVSISQTAGSIGAQTLCWSGNTPNDGNNYDGWTGGGVSMTFAKASGSGTETAIIGSAGVYKATFIYNYLLDGWMLYGRSGLVQSQPYEAIVDVCNRLGVNCWFNWGNHKGQYITDVTNFFATNLNAGLKFGTEPGNEIWNFSANPFGQYDVFGSLLNLSPGSYGIFGYAALRLMQYTPLAKAAWAAAGRPASDFKIHQPNPNVAAGGIFDQYQLQGVELTTSNPVYAAHAALGGGVTATSYNVAPNRPVDITFSLGFAPYWSSPWFSSQGIVLLNNGVADNIPWLQASKDWALGNTAAAFTSMANQFNGTTVRAGALTGQPGFVGGIMLGSDPGYRGPQGEAGISYAGLLATQEALAASYDGSRPAGMAPLAILHYEGGPQWDPVGTPATSMTVNNPYTISDLAGRLGSAGVNAHGVLLAGLNWDVRAYDALGSTDLTIAANNVAAQVINMCIAWKHDDTYKNLIKNFVYQPLVDISGAHREVHPAHYGYDNSLWGLFETSYSANVRFKSFNAMAEWNA